MMNRIAGGMTVKIILILVLFVVLLTTVSAVTCKKPIPSNNHLIVHPKNWTSTNYTHGAVFVVACKNGFAIGRPSSICVNGTWTRLQYRCIANCPRSVTIPNGRVIWKSLLNGGMIQITCMSGFTLEGNSLLHCVKGNWNHKLPSCKATCSEPDGIQYGRREGSDYRHGSKVTYSCLPKYFIDGASSLTCNNGKWNNKVPSCRPMQCNGVHPGILVNGQLKAPRGYVHGAVIYFKCNDNFEMEGSSTIKCRNDNTWTGTVPKCLAPCKELGEIQHCTKLGSDYKHGKKVRYQCWPRYVLDGAKTLTCVNGQWDNPVPICRAPCKSPTHPRYGVVIGDDFRHGSQVRYKCNKGFTLRGVATRTCNSGSWSGAAPLCVSCSGEFDTLVGSCCSPSAKCQALHGDCDSDSDCQYGLKCGTNNCSKKPFFQPDEDCCVPTCSGDTKVLVGDCCSPPFDKCPAHHGDCDRDSDCQDGLVCGTNNCPKKPGFSPNDDCCHRECSGDIRTRHADCCTPMNKCPAFHGDCDSNDDCQYGLKCGVNNCPSKPGFRSHYDCCVPNCSGDVAINTDHCCSTLNKCPKDHGDCDYDDDCQEGLYCGTNNCPKKIAFDSESDCCTPVCSGDFMFNHLDCCSSLNKCPAFHGDCDSDADCQDGLICGTDNCVPTKRAFRSHYDCCVPDCEQKTTGGNCCVFPFEYRGTWYTSCTSVNHYSLWCSLTRNYKGSWGNCR